ncbi:MAG: hypothetical protein ABW049_05210 [Spongiibacteraceae bacterium]
MNLFRAFLVIGWIAVMVVTVHAFQELGPDGGSVFFGDFAHPWRAQFLSDFSLHLVLMAIWMIYREPKLWIGVICAFFSIMAGGAFSLAYIFIVTLRVNGDVRKLLLGKHA